MNVTSTVTSPNAVFNLDWSGFARSSDVEKGANKIAGSVDKATEKITGKLATDLQRGMDRVTSAVKDSTEKVCDSIKKVATTNANQPAAPQPAVEALCQGLVSVSESVIQIAEAAHNNPAEIQATLEKAKAIAKQFTELTDRASRCADEGRRLQQTAAEVEKSAGWIGSSLCSCGCGCGGNAQSVHVGNGAFNALWQQYGNQG
jgi:hypothetical protein